MPFSTRYPDLIVDSALQAEQGRIISVSMRHFSFFIAAFILTGVGSGPLPALAQTTEDAAPTASAPVQMAASYVAAAQKAFEGTADTTDVNSSCPAKPLDTRIHVKLDMPEPKIDHTQSRYDLRDFNVSTKSPYGKGRFTHVNGLMRGPVELSTKMTIAWQADPQTKENCFWYRTVNLVLKLKPVIYVASEVPDGKCYYNAIIEHEMKHVEVDRGLVRDYQNIVYDTIENFIQQNGTIDRIPLGGEKEAQRQLSDALEDQIRDIHKRMREERISRQAQVDNIKEYDRVASECSLQDKIGN